MHQVKPFNTTGGNIQNTNNTTNGQSQQQNTTENGAVVKFTSVYTNVLPTLQQNLKLVRFAYFLYKYELVKNHPQDDDNWIAIRQRVNFCNCAKLRPYSALTNTSRLGQFYTADIFGGDYYTTLWAKKEGYPDNMHDRCSFCEGDDGENFRMCPYFICDIITRAAEEYKISPEVIFNDLLGSTKPDFRGTTVKKLDCPIPEEDIKGINSNSAYGAYLLLASKMINIISVDGQTVRYSHVKLCSSTLRENIITKMNDFWQDGVGENCTLNLSDMSAILSHDGCKACEYVQCPHKLAAYITYLSRKYNVDSIDLAYFIAKNSTYAGVSITDNYQFDRFLATVKKAPMPEDSKQEYTKMIYYIAGRKVNRKIPFLPFNFTLTSPDDEKADEVIRAFFDAVWHFDYFYCGSDNTNKKNIYLSSITFSELCKEYNDAERGMVFVLHDVGLLRENRDFSENYHKLLRIMEDRRNDIMSIIVGEKLEVVSFFAAYPAFKSKVFTKSLEMVDMNSTSVMEALENKLISTFTISEDVRQRLEQYIRVAYPASSFRGMEFVNDLYEKLLFNHYNSDVNADAVLRASDLPYIKPPRSEEDIFSEINLLTGLNNVKQELRNVNDLVKFNMKIGSVNSNAVNLHMVFTGNPGTGKTTVARLTAEILHNIGFINENKLVVCSAKDLIGEYLGQTTPKTAKKCEEAYNGVLFIDEAYQLNPVSSGRSDSFKEECIAELIQQMENNRDRLVVIFAGYTEEMEDFLNKANTGLRSRIGKIIDFPDYSEDELVEIFKGIATRSGIQLGDGVSERVRGIFATAKQDAKRFGNARYARNLFERSLMQHAAITSYLDKDDPALRLLTADEITLPSN